MSIGPSCIRSSSKDVIVCVLNGGRWCISSACPNFLGVISFSLGCPPLLTDDLSSLSCFIFVVARPSPYSIALFDNSAGSLYWSSITVSKGSVFLLGETSTGAISGALATVDSANLNCLGFSLSPKE